MAKETFQDIIRSKSKDKGQEKDIDMSFRRGFDQFNDSSSGGHSRYTMWFIALGSVAFLFIVLSYFFSGATVTVIPKQAIVPLEGLSFEATKTTSITGLSFDVMSVQGDSSKIVPATEERVDATKASGQIIIYNNFSSASQQLIINTRFETPDGKIYRINKGITVPGQQKKNGETIPGSLEVTVYADQPGVDYNIPLTDFTIPGFKGGSRFEKIYARSKTPMTGGSTGPVNVLPASSADQARVELSDVLKQKLILQAQAELPEGYVLFEGGTFFNETIMQGDIISQSKDVTVSTEGTLDAVIFNKQELVDAITKVGVREYDGLPVDIDTENLTLTLKNHDLLDPRNIQNITFDFTGTAEVVWFVDKQSLKEALVGEKKKSFNSIVSEYPSIEKASITTSPFWKTHISSNLDKIQINISNK